MTHMSNIAESTTEEFYIRELTEVWELNEDK